MGQPVTKSAIFQAPILHDENNARAAIESYSGIQCPRVNQSVH